MYFIGKHNGEYKLPEVCVFFWYFLVSRGVMAFAKKMVQDTPFWLQKEGFSEAIPYSGKVW